LETENDVFYLGMFKNVANANLAVNSFPIIYQARYREQQLGVVKDEIDKLISQVESTPVDSEKISSPDIDPEEKLLKEYIPNMLYTRNDPKAFENAEKKFRHFLSGHKFPEDIDRIIEVISDAEALKQDHYKLLELYSKKIISLSKENFSEAEDIKKQIQKIEESLGNKNAE
ncbi:MAG: hypothetical protein ACOCSE_05695, partial [Chitinivibrionales bacterium]